MTRIRPKEARLRLDSASYKQLCREVLDRDGWKCQSCGTPEKLQVHHKKFRSRRGDDSEDNLVTLCADCHNSVHQRGK
jgi:5-methylcytosine-specific restriction endonuclease McrA